MLKLKAKDVGGVDEMIVLDTEESVEDFTEQAVAQFIAPRRRQALESAQLRYKEVASTGNVAQLKALPVYTDGDDAKLVDALIAWSVGLPGYRTAAQRKTDAQRAELQKELDEANAHVGRQQANKDAIDNDPGSTADRKNGAAAELKEATDDVDRIAADIAALPE